MKNKNTLVYLTITFCTVLLLSLTPLYPNWSLLVAFVLVPFWSLATFAYFKNKSQNLKSEEISVSKRHYFAWAAVLLYVVLLSFDFLGNNLARSINIWFVENLIVYPILFICALIVLRDIIGWMRS